MKNNKIEKQIEKLESKNRLLTNEISQLNTGQQTVVEQKRIDGNFEEININNLLIKNLKNKLL